MNKDELYADISKTIWNVTVHETHGDAVRKDAGDFEDEMRESMALTVPSRTIVLDTEKLIVFNREAYLKIQNEMIETEEATEEAESQNNECTGPWRRPNPGRIHRHP